MSKHNDRMVYRRQGGEWANQRMNRLRPGSLHSTQRAAESAAKRMLTRAGGGELTVMDRDGKIRSKDTIGGGNDPRSIRDTEH